MCSGRDRAPAHEKAVAGSWDQIAENKRTLGSPGGEQDICLGFSPAPEEPCGPSEAGLLSSQLIARTTWWSAALWMGLYEMAAWGAGSEQEGASSATALENVVCLTGISMLNPSVCCYAIGHWCTWKMGRSGCSFQSQLSRSWTALPGRSQARTNRTANCSTHIECSTDS